MEVICCCDHVLWLQILVLQFYVWRNSLKAALFICFVQWPTTPNLISRCFIYLTQLLVLELISQFHCQLETYSLVHRNSWSQIFSASTLSRCPDSCTISAEVPFIPHKIIDIFTVSPWFLSLPMTSLLSLCYYSVFIFWKCDLHEEFTSD